MATSNGPIVEVRDLTAAYGDDVVLDGVSMQVNAGEVFVIAGGSGCGKSTLLKHMIGLYEPVAGHVLIDGRDIVGAFGAERTRILNRIGVTYQGGALFGSMSLLENVRLPLEEFTELPPEAMDLIALTKLRLVGLAPFAAHAPAEVSGGMQKRAAIARAMALDPAILFLDEPSAGLDPITSAELDGLILRLRDSLKATFVIVSHELRSIFTVADRVALLDKEARNIIATGPPEELRDCHGEPHVHRFFNPHDPAAPTPAAIPQNGHPA